MTTLQDMTSHAQHAIEQFAITMGSKVGATGTITAVGSGAAGKLAENVAANPATAQNVIEWSTIGVQSGILLGLLGFAVQAYYQRKRNKREEEQRAEERREAELREEMHRLQKAVLEEQLGVKFCRGEIP